MKSRLSAGIGLRYLRLYTLAPCGEQGVHSAGAFGFFQNHVALLGDVIAQVEKFQAAVFKKFDQLPVTIAHGGSRRPALIPVVGIVPEEGSALRLLTLEGRKEARAVTVLVRQ